MSSFQSKALGKILFEQVCKQLNLLEVDYFGLEYQDVQGITVRFLFEMLKNTKYMITTKLKPKKVISAIG